MKSETEIEVQRLQFDPDGDIPNNQLPVLLYRGVYETPPGEHELKELLARHNWGDCWTNGIYDYQHFHSTAHEFLGVLAGKARILIGGPQGQPLFLTPGDFIILPAGTGHKCEQSSEDFLILGAYPDGQQWDLLTGASEERAQAQENIKHVAKPTLDPIYGEDGPLKRLW